MSKIGAIAAMTKDRVIGVDNEIPWHYPEDFKRFKRVTLNSVIIMGRKTWESIGSRALPKRRNIVISRKPVIGIEHYHGIDSALKACQRDNPVWFIGGGHIYREALRHCDHLDITTVPDDIPAQQAVLFPEIDAQQWRIESDFVLDQDPRLNIKIYTRI